LRRPSHTSLCRISLLLDRNNAVTEYLRDDLRPFVNCGMEMVLPLISMERLIGLVFLSLGQAAPTKTQLMNLQLLSQQAGLAFENALLFKERLRQNERMYRAEQLATMGQFAAGIAHELRNPLTAIRSTIQFLASEFAVGSEQQKLSEITLEANPCRSIRPERSRSASRSSKPGPAARTSSCTWPVRTTCPP
jgi:signal transduction histidine kinase